jgi:Ca-activated chloride channel family protein
LNSFFQHFAFKDPAWILLLLLVLPLFFLRRRIGAAASIGFSSLSILGSVGQRTHQRPGALTAALLIFAIITAIFALARPQWRNEYVARTASGIDILIALDVSYSMEIPDFYPNDDRRLPRKQRILVAKEVIRDFIDLRPDDRIGLVAFSGRPYAVSPITMDHDWLKLNLERIKLGEIKEQGTAIGSAIAASSTRLTKRDAKSKVVVLVTDGANNSGKLDPIEAAKLASELGIRIYTIAIGSEDGRVSNRRQSFPAQEFDETTLREIASLTNAEFFRCRDVASLRNTFDSINTLEKSESKTHTVVDADEWFLWFIGTSFVLAFLALSSIGLNPPPMPS